MHAVRSSLLGALDRFTGRRVLVLGEAILDSYLVGDSTRLCQEAPVPVVAVHQRRDNPGGAANTAVNLAALGCRVELLSVVGDDYEGGRLLHLLRQHGVDTGSVAVQAGRQTLAKHRVMSGDQLLVRFDQGDTEPVAAGVERELLDRLTAAFSGVDAVVISDYGYGVMTKAVVARLQRLQARWRRLVCVDARDLTRYRAVGITAVKPNFEEAVRLAGAASAAPPHDRATASLGLGELVLNRTGARIAAITLDRDGALIVERGQPAYRTYAEPADQTRAAGAGDTYIAALTVALAAGAPTAAAAEIASRAAALVVSRDGTAVCTGDDLRRALGAGSAEMTPPRARRLGLLGGRAPGDTCERGALSPETPAQEDATERRGGPNELGARRAPALHQA